MLVLPFSCKDEDLQPADIGLSYFPLKKGFFQIYQVNETIYPEGKDMVLKTYDLKVEVADSFATDDNEYTYVLYLYTRENVDDVWNFSTTWSAKRNDRQAVITEGNISYIKLLFPVRQPTSWNGNALNSLTEDEYDLKDAGASVTILGATFNNTVTVEQEYNDDTVVYYDLRSEIYARDAGLILKSMTQLEYCTDLDCIGQKIIKRGRIYKQELKEYGIQ